MVIFPPGRHSALHLPLALSAFAALALFSAVTSVRDDPGGGSALLVIFAFAISAVVLATLRHIAVREGQLRVRTPFGLRTLPADEVALGVSVRRSSRGSSYTVYARARHVEVDLADTFTERGAERMRERLQQRLLAEYPSGTDRQAESALHVARKEARWRQQDADAQAQVDAYYESGGAKRAVLWVLGAFVLCILAMALWLSTRGN